jgi:hypothetical protein
VIAVHLQGHGNTADIDRRLRRQRMRQSAMKKRDHVRNP